MPYPEVNLDPFISLKGLINTPLANPLNLLSYVETVGIAGVGFTYRQDIGYIGDLSSLRSMTSSRINIRIPADMAFVHKVLPLKPDVVTVVDDNSEHKTLNVPSDIIKEMVVSLRQNEVSGLALRIAPDIKQLKVAYQYGVDVVEIATNRLAKEGTRRGFLNALEEIVRIIRVAKKNGLRIVVAGELNRRLILELNAVVNVEFISVGRALLEQALMLGFDKALREFVDVVGNR